MNESLPTAGLLEAAANLIERAVAQLDVEHDRCPGCGNKRFRNMAHARVFEQFAESPEKLRRASRRLQESVPDGDEDAFDRMARIKADMVREQELEDARRRR